MSAHHGGHLPQGRQRPALPSGEGVRKIPEQPGTAKATPTHHHTGTTGLLHHGQSVRRLPDVTVAQHRDVDGLDQGGDRRPVGFARVGLAHRPCVERDGGTAGVLRDPARVQVREVRLVDAQSGLHGHRHAVGRRRPPRWPAGSAASRSRFHGSTPPPPRRVTLGTGQPKLRSTCETPNSAHRISVAAAITSGRPPRTAGPNVRSRPDRSAACRRSSGFARRSRGR